MSDALVALAFVLVGCGGVDAAEELFAPAVTAPGLCPQGQSACQWAEHPGARHTPPNDGIQSDGTGGADSGAGGAGAGGAGTGGAP